MQKVHNDDANNEISNICDQIAKRVFLVNFLLDLFAILPRSVSVTSKKEYVKSFPASKHDSISRKKSSNLQEAGRNMKFWY